MREMIVAAFASPSVAAAAVRDLETAQIPSADIKSYTKDEPSYQEYRTRQPENQRGGFWSWLLGEEPDQTQRYAAYDTSLASGDTVVTVTVDELHADAAMAFLLSTDLMISMNKRVAAQKPTKPAQPQNRRHKRPALPE